MKRKGRGNDWCESLVYSCPKCGLGNLCDVCHEHDEPRGECTVCPRTCKCEACSPAPAPQPPADATPTRRKLEELVDTVGDLPTTALATSGLRPAAPHVAVDGDASDEVIAAEMAMEEIDTFGPPEDEDALAGIITKAIARGRELGARDAEVRIKPRTETTVKP